ncbi:hypothetical protein UT300005_11360 [Clostridium sp. CTA-5]
MDTNIKINIRELILFGILSGVVIVSQIALSFIPNVELVTLLIILFSLIYKRKALYITGIFVVAMGLIHGFGTWWIGYLILWPLLSILTVLIRSVLLNKYLLLSIYSGIFGLLFGFFYAIPYAIFGGINAGITYWVAGIPFDIIHGVSNYFIMLLLGERLFNLIINLNKKYNLN